MGTGRTFREAERITGFIMTSIVMVLTLMGYRISFSDYESPEEKTDLPYTIPGIHTGFAGSDCCGYADIVVDARGALRSF